MSMGFYPRLARNAIRKNKRLYLPYFLTGAVMVMMHYILRFLADSPALEQMEGGSFLRYLLPLGCFVIGVFSLLLLCYTDSFLMKQRSREFGLYYILGMDQRNIGRLMLWEKLFTAAITVAGGLVCGVAFSKLAELILLNLLGLDVDFALNIGLDALWQTAALYAGFYGSLWLWACFKLRRTRPFALMQRENVGEKVPKRNWLFAVIGIALLGGAYYMAVTIKEPATALFDFFFAVLMVIVGTYLLMISGSVAFCRMLQKNRRYYYHPDHFVSVSSMVYRMKRNGAGLASICILLTMVLVMLTSTVTLYFGEEDALSNRYPNDINIKIDYDTIDGIRGEKLERMREAIGACAPLGTDLTGTCYAVVAGQFTDDGILLDYTRAERIDYDRVGYLYVISVADYNAMTGGSRSLTEEECLIYCDRLSIRWECFSAENGRTYTVAERLTEFREDGGALAMTMPCAYLVVADVYAFAEPFFDWKNDSGLSMVEYEWICGLDCDSERDQIEIGNRMFETIGQWEDDTIRYYHVEMRALARDGFYELYGGLFFIGIMLSVVFLLAAVLIIYYKQISEGYEDQKRFELMLKVGMSKKNIRRTVNAQVLTVFFLPLVLAGIHLVFAYPFVSKILLLFAFDNTLLNVAVNLVCYGIFGVFYAVVYRLTSVAYYRIVSREER